MRLRTLGIAALLSSSLYQHSEAVVRPKGAEAPVVSAGQGPRSLKSTSFKKTTQLASVGLSGWTAIWDQDTDVPLRLWANGIVVSGSNANAAIAEAAARQFLATHLAVLAPGATVADFELVSNQLGGNGAVRSIGFIQRAHGIRVQGGSIGFAFKNDRLAMVSSTALPNVVVQVPAHRLSQTAVANSASRWLADGGQQVVARTVSSFAPSERVIIPIVRPRTSAAVEVSYRVAEQVAVDATTGPGRWNVWVDAASAAPIARRSLISYASGKVLFNVGERGPHTARSPQPGLASHTVNGAATLAGLDGTVTWTGDAAASVTLKVNGPLVAIANGAGVVIAETLSLAVNGTLLWDHSTEELADAQLSAFVYANQAKQFAKLKLNPTLAYLDQRLSVTVNEDDTCNAYSTGDDIHFFRKGQQCENTGRLSDVVYHEFGHSLHANSIIEGVGGFDGGLSEGLSDTLSMAITGDPGMGRGFFFTNAALRNLNPTGSEKHWPEDATGQVHNDGEIIGGTLWDLRTALEAKLGVEAGYEQWLVIFYSLMQRASDIPSTYAEALLADDDDGDLANGTPNQCEINAAFGLHGLSDPSVSIGLSNPVRDGFNVSIKVTAPASSACPGPSVESAVLDWKPRGAGGGGQVALTSTADIFAGDIPSQPDGTVVQYKVTVTLSDGTKVSYPNNAADPLYEFYVGEVTKLYCASFESGETGAADWATGGQGNEWEDGAPAGLGGDPKTAFEGTGVFGLDLTSDGIYVAGGSTFAETPEIDLQGHTKVRLQYQRWLGVEDAFYDRAHIAANGKTIWTNFASQTEPQQAGIHHIDREWRFQDVDLSAETATGKLKLRFALDSDEGLEMGGWTLDNVCIVALSGAALTCGNAAEDTGETCDDGNRVDGDGCSANCQDETPADEGGCCSTSSGPEAALALGVLTLGLVLRRRRRD